MNQQQPEAQHRANERKHWTTIESRALWLNVFTCVAAIVGLVGLVGLILTLREARTATEAANRAWISPIYGRLFVPAVGQPGHVQIRLYNQGREPAVDVNVFVHFDTAPSPENKDLSTTEAITDNVCDPAPTPNILKMGLVPPGPLELTVRTNIQGSDLTWSSDLDNGRDLLRAKACVTYVTFQAPHYTRSCRLFPIVISQPKNPTAQGSTAAKTAQEAIPGQEPLSGPTTGQDVIAKQGFAGACNGGDSAN
jgi:hypothetical protein